MSGIPILKARRGIPIAARVLAAMLPACGIAAAPSTNALQALEATYNDERLAIDVTSARHRQDALRQYGSAVDALMSALKQKGDLKAYLQLEAEKNRFDREASVPAATNALPALAGAAAAYHRASAAIEDDQNRQTVAMLKKQALALDALIKDLMQANRIADAKDAQAERDRVGRELASRSPPKPGKSTPPGKLTISATIDGHDQLLIRNYSLWLQNFGWDRPSNVLVNGRKWDIRWNGKISRPYRVDSPVPDLPPDRFTLKVVQGRGSVKLLAASAPGTQDALKIDFIDSGRGAGRYEIVLSW